MKFTNKLNLPDALVAAIQNDPYDNGGAWRSVTQLISPPRQVALRKKHEDEITEDAADRLYSTYGQLIHSLLERANVGCMVEGRLFMDVLQKKISGQYDSFDAKKGHVTEWKFSTVWKARELPEEWCQQVNLQAELLRHNGHVVNSAEVILLCRDHSKLEAKRSADYPQLPVVRLPVPVWSKEKAGAFLLERVKAHLDAETTLPDCTPAERWAKPPTWAVKKPGASRATRVCATEVEANALAKGGLVVEHRPGESVRCENYCAVNFACSQYQATIAGSKKAVGNE